MSIRALWQYVQYKQENNMESYQYKQADRNKETL